MRHGLFKEKLHCALHETPPPLTTVSLSWQEKSSFLFCSKGTRPLPAHAGHFFAFIQLITLMTSEQRDFECNCFLWSLLAGDTPRKWLFFPLMWPLDESRLSLSTGGPMGKSSTFLLRRITRLMNQCSFYLNFSRPYFNSFERFFLSWQNPSWFFKLHFWSCTRKSQNAKAEKRVITISIERERDFFKRTPAKNKNEK